MSTASEEGASASPPEEPSVSRGSSVSSSLRDEYEDLLRYAVVTPIVDTRRPSKGGPSLKKTEGGGRPSKPLTNAPKRPIQTESEQIFIHSVINPSLFIYTFCFLILLSSQ